MTSQAGAQVLPTGISGLRLWLDASDVNNNGVNPANGTAVNTWYDRSGLNNHATVFGSQSAGVLNTNQINGKPVVHFTRTSQTQGSVYEVTGVDIRATTLPAVTIFTVYRQGAQSGDQAVWGNDNGAWDRFFFSSWTSQVGANNGGVSRGTNAIIVNNAGLTGTTRLLTTVYDHNVAAGSAVYFDGQVVQTVQDITNTTDAQHSLRIGFDGDDNCFNGDIAEMIVYNRKLDPCEIQQINRYLGAKYGVTFSSVAITPASATSFPIGGSVTLNSSPAGTAYQWLRNGVPIPSATSASYTATTSGAYRVAITANSCTDTSAAVTVNAFHMAPPGNALRLDGTDDYVDFGNPAALAPANIRTLECWARFNTFTGDQEILSKSITGNGIELLTYGSNLAFFVMNGTAGSSIAYPLSNLQTGVWYHLAATWDGSTKESMRLYVNGAPVGNRNDNGNLNTNGVGNPGGSTFKIGNWSQGSNPRYFNGSIDEVRIWNTQRTQAQLSSANRDTLSSATAGLIAYYRFDHGTAGGSNAGINSLYDFTGNGLTGTLNNFSLSGSSSNWIESYAMVVPTPVTATSITANSFRANWTAPTAGTVSAYYLTVATDTAFTSILPSYNNLNVGTVTSYNVTGLSDNTNYYYRVRANKTSVTDQATAWSFGSVLTANPLPVQWVSFNAARRQQAVQLSWSCLRNDEARGFEVQRSTDGRSFVTVSGIAPNASGHYESSDLSAPSGLLYYRIKVSDRDGRSYYSATRSVNAQGIQGNYTLSPVPSGTEVWLRGDGALAGSTATVVNAAGQTIAELLLGTGDQRIDIRTWPAGHYFLHLANGQVLKLVRY